jgi:hypothetical protein
VISNNQNILPFFTIIATSMKHYGLLFNPLILRSLITIILLFSLGELSAQLSGTQTYRFLEMTHSARVASLGANTLSVNDADLSLAASNPALISDDMHMKLSMNYLNYFADINAGFLSYGHKFDKTGTFVASLQFINYGDFIETDYTGQEYGTLSASEYAFTLGWSKRLSERFTLGANLKNILSQMADFSSYGLAVDLAANYLHSNQRFSASLIAANIGRQITTYTDLNREAIPFNLKMAISSRFEHAPLRLHFIADQLQQWDLTYRDPNQEVEIDPFTGEEIKTGGWEFGDKLMRHVTVGGEFIPGKGNFSVRLGYNYRRRSELRIASRKAMVGFSWGFGLKIKKLHLAYARATYNLAGATNHFTLSTTLSDFF